MRVRATSQRETKYRTDNNEVMNKRGGERKRGWGVVDFDEDLERLKQVSWQLGMNVEDCRMMRWK